MGRASESLMRPAVGRHHRSSRALTQDAPTLWDLLIFEIARPGMFIWRRGCRRESPASRSSLPLSLPRTPLFQFAGWHFSTPSAARRVAVFLFSPPMYPSYSSPFYHLRRGDDGSRRRRRRLKCQLWEKRDNAPERTRLYNRGWLVHPASHITRRSTLRLHPDYLATRLIPV